MQFHRVSGKDLTTDYTDSTDKTNTDLHFSYPCYPCNPWLNLLFHHAGDHLRHGREDAAVACGTQRRLVVRAGRHDPGFNAGAAAGFDVDFHVADVEGILFRHAEPFESLEHHRG